MDVDECAVVNYALNETFDDAAEGALWTADDEGKTPSITVEQGMLNVSVDKTGGLYIVKAPPVQEIAGGSKVAFNISFHQPMVTFFIDWWTCSDPAGSEACTDQVMKQQLGGVLDYTQLLGIEDIPPDDLGSGKPKQYQFDLPQDTPGYLAFLMDPTAAKEAFSLDNLQVFTQANPCGAVGICENTEGGYSCSCPAGYVLDADGDGGCMDIDECAMEETPCGANATCTNTPGSYSCACNKGYEGDGIVCCLIDKDGYSPCGPQVNVPLGLIESGGWQPCHQSPYGKPLSGKEVIECAGSEHMMLACRQEGSDTIKLLAWAPTADVMSDTGIPGTAPGKNTDVVTVSNGSSWYNGSADGVGSIGFAKQGDPVQKLSCDNAEGGNQNMRQCWHLDMGIGGFRCGAVKNLNDNYQWERMIFVR